MKKLDFGKFFIIILFFIIFFLLSYIYYLQNNVLKLTYNGTKIDNNYTSVDDIIMFVDNKNNVRDLTSEDLKKNIPYNYKLITGGISYIDLDNDNKNEAILLLQNKKAKVGLCGFESIKDAKLIYLKFKNSKWVWYDTVNLDGTIVNGSFYNNINGKEYLYVITKSWGVSNGSKCLDVLQLENSKIKIIQKFCVNITNPGDILISNDYKNITVVGTAPIAGEGQECNTFEVKEYSFNKNMYKLVNTMTTISHFGGSIYKINDFVTYDPNEYFAKVYTNNCIWIFAYKKSCKNTNNKYFLDDSCINFITKYKVKSILEDVGLNYNLR